MASFDKYLDRVYSKSYTCYHFASDVWLDLTGIDLRESLCKMFEDQRLSRNHVRQFKVLKSPISPCLVVMQRGRTVPHIGIYSEGSILHLHGQGAEFQNITTATRGFTNVRYFTCKS